MNLSIITSIYRSEPFLVPYLNRAQTLTRVLDSGGIQCEIIVVANEASPAEIGLLDKAASRSSVRVLYVPRETLYASWNRGVRAAKAPCVGFWNVDDIRYAKALVEGLDLLEAGHDVVDYPFEIVNRTRRLPWNRRYVSKSQFAQNHLTPKSVFSPFFIFSQSCYEKVGPFDASFRVAGDLEWTIRAMGHSRCVLASNLGGCFFIHGTNLSNTGALQEMIEINIIMMRYGEWDQVRPTPDPEAMHSNWMTWGNTGDITVPNPIAQLLWGPHARQEWKAWYGERQRQLRRYRLRTIPRTLINRLGLRSFLARLYLVHKEPDRY